jgi:hypothetical protein
MKLIIFLRTGYENTTPFKTRTTVFNNERETTHWTLGHRYQQNAISYNSETVIFPIHNTR